MLRLTAENAGQEHDVFAFTASEAAAASGWRQECCMVSSRKALGQPVGGFGRANGAGEVHKIHFCWHAASRLAPAIMQVHTQCGTGMGVKRKCCRHWTSGRRCGVSRVGRSSRCDG